MYFNSAKDERKYFTTKARLARAEKIIAMYLSTASSPARGPKKFDLADCDAKARAYFAEPKKGLGGKR